MYIAIDTEHIAGTAVENNGLIDEDRQSQVDELKSVPHTKAQDLENFMLKRIFEVSLERVYQDPEYSRAQKTGLEAFTKLKEGLEDEKQRQLLIELDDATSLRESCAMVHSYKQGVEDAAIIKTWQENEQKSLEESPGFIEAYDSFAKQYNRLEGILDDYGLGHALLRDVVAAARKVEKMLSKNASSI